MDVSTSKSNHQASNALIQVQKKRQSWQASFFKAVKTMFNQPFIAIVVYGLFHGESGAGRLTT